MNTTCCELSKEAIDEALKDGVKQAFQMLHLGVIDGTKDVRGKFDAALRDLRATYDMACCAAAEVLEK